MLAIIKEKMQYLDDLPPSRREKKIICSEFLSIILEKYHADRNIPSTSF